MSHGPRKKSPAITLRSLYLWHRYMGLTAAIFVILLAISGLALNHTEELELDSTYVQADVLLDVYGIHAPDEMTSFAVGSHIVTAVKEQVFRESERLEELASPLIGALAYKGIYIVASTSRLLLFTDEWALIEKLDSAAGVPAGIQAIGTATNGMLAIRAAHGDYLTNEDFLEWRDTEAPEVRWSHRVTTPAAIRDDLQVAYRGRGLSLERVMLDIHSGRILGKKGVYLVDAATLLFLILAVSGVWLWGRRRSSARAHQRKIRKR